MCVGMLRDYTIAFLIIGCLVLSMLIFVNKKDIKKVFLAVLVAQTFTWSLGLLLTSLGKFEYPVRLFPKATNSSFLQGYIVNPLIYSIYYIHHPHQVKLLYKLMYTLLFTAIPTSIEIIEYRYTNLLRYKTWNGFYTFMLQTIAYFIISKYLDWFFENISNDGVTENEA